MKFDTTAAESAMLLHTCQDKGSDKVTMVTADYCQLVFFVNLKLKFSETKIQVGKIQII